MCTGMSNGRRHVPHLAATHLPLLPRKLPRNVPAQQQASEHESWGHQLRVIYLPRHLLTSSARPPQHVLSMQRSGAGGMR